MNTQHNYGTRKMESESEFGINLGSTMFSMVCFLAHIVSSLGQLFYPA